MQLMIFIKAIQPTRNTEEWEIPRCLLTWQPIHLRPCWSATKHVRALLPLCNVKPKKLKMKKE